MTDVNSGFRIDVDLPDYSGKAGFVETGETASLSYRPRTTAPVPLGTRIAANGSDWEVTTVGMSPYMRGFRLIALRKVTEA